MNKILIVDASVSDIRVMSNLLSRAGYAPLGVESTSLVTTYDSSLQQWLARYIYPLLARCSTPATPSIFPYGYRLAAFVAKRRKKSDGSIINLYNVISLRYSFYGGWRNVKLLTSGEGRRLRDCCIFRIHELEYYFDIPPKMSNFALKAV